MQPLSSDEVRQIAALARLELSDAEVEALRGELRGILEHMDALAQVEVHGVLPMTHAVPMTLRLRSDDVEDSLPVEQALAQAADSKDDQFRVPHIIKKSGA